MTAIVVSPDFARLRVDSPRHSASVTALVAFESFLRIEPDAVAQQASNDLFTVKYIDRPLGNLPTFVIAFQVEPVDPEKILRYAAQRIEDSYDSLSNVQLVR
jgi:hypothetical protein